MNTLEKEWTEIRERYAPANISRYVEKSVERMYFGSAPTLGALASGLDERHYEYLITALVTEIFKFAGMKESFPEDVMNTVAHTMRTEYPWLKITEVMHFVYLFRLGNFDRFYGKPSAAALMQMLRQYIKVDRERLKAEFQARREKEERIVEMARAKALGEGSRQQAARLEIADWQAKIAALLSEEGRAKARWRYEPYGTAMARAYFVDGLLQKGPHDMTEQERYEWAQENAAYVKAHPNLNVTA